MSIQLHRCRTPYITVSRCTSFTIVRPSITPIALFLGYLKARQPRWYRRRVLTRSRILMTIGEHTVSFGYFVRFQLFLYITEL
jgi:hypothetical protein